MSKKKPAKNPLGLSPLELAAAEHSRLVASRVAGGKKRWKNKTPAQRSEQMRKVALAKRQ